MGRFYALLLSAISLFSSGALASPADCARLYAREHKLSAYDTGESKQAHIQQLFSSGAKNFVGADAFARKVLALDLTEQREWLSAIGAVYRELPKKDPNPMAARHMGGRRLADRAFHSIQRADLRMKDLVQKEGPLQAFRRYIEEQAVTFGANYGAAEVEKVIGVAQAFLKKQMPRERNDPALILAGSFVNGKAQLGISDLDVSLRNLKENVPELEALLRAALPPPAGAMQALTVKAQSIPAGYYGQLSPVVLEVTRERVKVYFYPPGQALGADEIRAGIPNQYEFVAD